MKYFTILLLAVVSCNINSTLRAPVSQSTAVQEIKGTLTNSANQADKPYVILVSLDGFRHDYAQRYGANHMLSFDVKAERMTPSFPSKTFPNHYAIATGLYPGHNGLVSNEFYDKKLALRYSIRDRSVVENPSFYNGTPLWVLASNQNMVNASMFWVGSEAPIKGIVPTYYYKYNASFSHEDRVNQVISWLQLPEENRPHLITLYFSLIDDLGHAHGPDSEQVAKGVKSIDNTIGDLMSKVNQLDLPINIIIVSDHGMLEVDRQQIIYLDSLLPANINYTASFPAMVYSDDAKKIDSIYTNLLVDTSRFKVYLKNNLPKRFHYDAHQERIGDLVIMPKPPYTFGSEEYDTKKGSSTHGYDPAVTPEMGAIFYANGPAFKKQSHPISAFENIHVYPMIAQILGLTYEKDSIDGSIEILLPILK